MFLVGDEKRADGFVTPFPGEESGANMSRMDSDRFQLAPCGGSPWSSEAVADGARIRVLIADDHPAVRVGIRRLLSDQPDVRIVAEAKSALEAVSLAGASPGVAVIDYHLGDRNGLWVTRRLRQVGPQPRILIYSAFTDDALAIAAVVAGADGLLSKSSIGEELCVAIRRLAAGHRYLPSISPSLAREMRARLDPGHQAIFGMLAHGISPEQIIARLPITSRQLETQRAAILAALAPAATRARQPTPTPMPSDYERL
jgi:DNA-binding NarL/FixJ family response regulator